MSKIQWTDVTDNIIVAAGGGWWCRKISPGCLNCYAAKLNDSGFFGGNHLSYSGQPPNLKLRRELIASWARQTKPKKHFVASMTDVFGEWVPREWTFEFLDGMAAAPRQTFQVLTKRADKMRADVQAWLAAHALSEVPSHIWLGVSVENQRCADERIPELLKTPAKVRFLSAEPLLSSVGLNHCMVEGGGGGLDWVIVGGESGLGARGCNVDWIRGIVSQCRAAGVPCFVKQLGTNPYERFQKHMGAEHEPLFLKHSKGGDPAEWPADLQVREFPRP